MAEAKTRAEKIKETKAKKAAEAEAARIEGNILQRLDTFTRQKHLYLNPVRKFKLGEKVIILNSNLRNGEVIEVVDDLFYRIKFEYTENNYGKKIERKSERYVSWIDVLPQTAVSREENFNTRALMLDARISFHNGEIGGLLSKYYYFGVDMSPEYQRGFVWTQEDKEKLIESIFQGIEIGKFAFIRLPYEANKPGYEILDGKQRLSCIIEFMQDRFTYRGFKFSELSAADRRYFEGYLVTSGEAEEGITMEQKLRYFLKMNTGGRAQDPAHMEEIRKKLEALEGKNK